MHRCRVIHRRQDNCVEECKRRAVSEFCSTEMDMPLPSKHCARPAVHRSTKRPFLHFTNGVQNLGASGVWWCRSRLNNSTGAKPAGGLSPEIPKTKSQGPNKFNRQIPKSLAQREVPLSIEIWYFLGVWCLGFGASAVGGFNVENGGRQ